MIGPRTEIAVQCEDGVVLQVERIPACGRVRGVAVLLHAMMVDRRSMDRPPGAGLATTLASEGWEVWNADFRGHGGSVVERWSYDDLVMYDVPALVHAARAAGGPVWVVGLSLGGHVSLASVAARACAPDGLVLLSANVWLPSLEPSLARRLMKHLSGGLLLRLTRVLGRFPSRGLRVGPADESLDYIEDLIRFWRQDRWASRGDLDWRAGLAGLAGGLSRQAGMASWAGSTAPPACLASKIR